MTGSNRETSNDYKIVADYIAETMSSLGWSRSRNSVFLSPDQQYCLFFGLMPNGTVDLYMKGAGKAYSRNVIHLAEDDIAGKILAWINKILDDA